MLAHASEGDRGTGRQAIGDPTQQAGLETQGTQLGQAVVGVLDLPVLGAGAAFGMSRRLRRRIGASKVAA